MDPEVFFFGTLLWLTTIFVTFGVTTGCDNVAWEKLAIAHGAAEFVIDTDPTNGRNVSFKWNDELEQAK